MTIVATLFVVTLHPLIVIQTDDTNHFKSHPSMKKLLATLVLVSGFYTAFSQVNWILETSHTSVQFAVDHMGFSETTGNFKKMEGTFQSSDDKVNNLTGKITIQIGSINTDNEDRDKHLQAEDFFDAQKYPTMTYAVKSIKKTGNNVTVTGDLTIKGKTKPVTMTGLFKGVGQDPYGGTRAGFARLTTTINRQDFGLTFNKTMAAGGLVVGDEVRITINAELLKK